MHLPGISLVIYPYVCFSVNLRDLWVTLLAFVGIIILQIFLSRREKWWPGLILPAAWLLWTLAVTVPQVVLSMRGGPWFTGEIEIGVTALAVENVPNLILLFIYAVGNLLRRRRQKKQLKKTRIDDI